MSNTSRRHPFCLLAALALQIVAGPVCACVYTVWWDPYTDITDVQISSPVYGQQYPNNAPITCTLSPAPVDTDHRYDSGTYVHTFPDDELMVSWSAKVNGQPYGTFSVDGITGLSFQSYANGQAIGSPVVWTPPSGGTASLVVFECSISDVTPKPANEGGSREDSPEFCATAISVNTAFESSISVEAEADHLCDIGSTTNVTVHVQNGGQPVNNHTVQFAAAPSGSINPSSVVHPQDFTNGSATVTFQADQDAGPITVIAKDLTLCGQDQYARLCAQHPEFGQAECEIYVHDDTQPMVTDDGLWTGNHLHATWVPGYLPYPEGTAHYEYAIGTEEGGTDVVDWTAVGSAQSVNRTDLTLNEEDTYYFAVRTHYEECMSFMAGVSDGIQVDLSAPSTPVITNASSTTGNTQLYASWEATDDRSGVAEYKVAISTSATEATPEEGTIVNWTSVGAANSRTFTGLSLRNGTYYFHVKARNNAGDWSQIGHSNPGITVGATYEPIFFSPQSSVYGYFCVQPPDQPVECWWPSYCGCLGVSLGWYDPEATVRYTVDGSDPTVDSPEYNPLGQVIVDPDQHPTIRARLFKNGQLVGQVWESTYRNNGACNPSPYAYTCWQWHDVESPIVPGLRIAGASHAGGTILALGRLSNGLPGNYQIKRKLATDQTAWTAVQQLGTSSTTTFTDTSSMQTGLKYLYGVRMMQYVEPEPSGLSECQHSPGDPDCHPYQRLRFPNGTDYAEISATRLEVAAAENQTVDARLDTRYVEDKFKNHKFGDSIYRGGLFVGFADDSSGVARSFLQFPNLTQPGSGERLWSTGLDVFYTRCMDSNQTVDVGWQIVGDNWTASDIVWEEAPALGSVERASALRFGSGSGMQDNSWCHWDVGAAATEIYGDHTLSIGLGSLNESAPGWAYFAKSQYDSDLTAKFVYAFGDAPSAAMSVVLDPSTVRRGYTVTGTVILNGPAPAGGTEVELSTDYPCYLLLPPSVHVDEGELTATFIASTAAYAPSTEVLVKADTYTTKLWIVTQ